MGILKYVARGVAGLALIAAIGTCGTVVGNYVTSGVTQEGDKTTVVRNYWPLGRTTYTHRKDIASLLTIETLGDSKVSMIDENLDNEIDALFGCDGKRCFWINWGPPGSRKYQMMLEAQDLWLQNKESLGIYDIIKDELKGKKKDAEEYTL